MKVVMTEFRPSVHSAAVNAVAGNHPRPSDQRAYRMTSIDIVRGLVIVIMALDHVRDHMMIASVQDPTADPSTGPLLLPRVGSPIFAPDVCVPCGGKCGSHGTPQELGGAARFLVLRGLWLILIEVLVTQLLSPFAQRVWPTSVVARSLVCRSFGRSGASMVVLGGMQYLGPRACLAVAWLSCSATICWTRHGRRPVRQVSRAFVGRTHARQAYQVGPLWVYFSYHCCLGPASCSLDMRQQVSSDSRETAGQ